MTNYNDDFFGIIVLFVLIASFMGMLVFAHGEGYKRGVDETLVLCMENAKDCKIKYDYLKLEEQKGL
jgi:hypothetical protein